MKWIAVIALAALPVGASSQTVVDWQNGACGMNGVWWPARPGNQCFLQDMAKYSQTSPPPTFSVTKSALTVTASAPHCPEGYSLVDAGGPMCAKDLRDPDWN
jgi:hypothetical protein